MPPVGAASAGASARKGKEDELGFVVATGVDREEPAEDRPSVDGLAACGLEVEAPGAGAGSLIVSESCGNRASSCANVSCCAEAADACSLATGGLDEAPNGPGGAGADDSGLADWIGTGAGATGVGRAGGGGGATRPGGAGAEIAA